MSTPIPPWTHHGKSPSIYTFFEAIALADLEGKPVRLDAATQRTLLGFPVFGRRLIVVQPEGAVTCSISACFGTDSETSTYPAHVIRAAAAVGKELRPGTAGGRYFNLATHPALP